MVTTRRLAETLGALGFPVPYYQPPQLAKLGQAIGRVADRDREEEDQSSAADMLSVGRLVGGAQPAQRGPPSCCPGAPAWTCAPRSNTFAARQPTTTSRR
jgi:hypothetical protein